jgi:CRP/FNR family cyclic AMP-dependent transcriptional regulator
MESTVSPAAPPPSEGIPAGATLIDQGQPGSDLFVLDDGELVVERDGIKIATITTPGAMIGEMAVILGRPASATVRAQKPSTVRIIRNAREHLKTDPELTFRLAYMMANRLDATSALLVDLSRQHADKPDRGLLGSILAALYGPDEASNYGSVARSDLFEGVDSAARF